MEFEEVTSDQGPVKLHDQVVGFGEEDLPTSQQHFGDAFEALNKIRPISRAEFDADVLKNYERAPQSHS
jgi:hypothetical protein